MPDEVKEQTETKAVEAVIYPETDTDWQVVSGRRIAVRPLKRRWQILFHAAALPFYRAETAGPENIIKAVKDGSWAFTSFSGLLMDAFVDSDKYLDRAAAIIIAANTRSIKNEQEALAAIEEEFAWIQENARTDELRKLVDAQIQKEGTLKTVGERSPVSFARLLSLTGVEITADSLKQILTNLLQKLQEIQSGAGDLTTVKPSGSSLDGSDATPSPTIRADAA